MIAKILGIALTTVVVLISILAFVILFVLGLVWWYGGAR